MLSKIGELGKRSQIKSSGLKDKNREKMKLVAKNARELCNFRNKIKKEIREYVKDNKEIKETQKLILHRPEELKDLIKNIEEDTDLENEFYLNSARTKLLKFLNNVINEKTNSEEDAKRIYVNNFLAYKQELENRRLHDGSRSEMIKKFINDAEHIILGPLFSPEQEIKKLYIAAGGDDRRKSVVKAISRLGDKEEPPTTGHGLKIMTQKQMISRLPILLAQKQAGSNSQKLNNEIRQIIYSLYRSKNLSKTIYNQLINNI